MFQILSGADPKDAADWISLWNEWPDREPYGHPSFLKLFSRPNDQVICAVWRSADGAIFFPLIKRQLQDEPWAFPCPKSDLTSPYGYGGAFRWGHPDETAFWAGFESWSRANEIVTCFTRMSLWPGQIAEPVLGQTETVAENVAIDLTSDIDTIWKGYKHKVRKNVNRAVRDGLRTEVDLEGKRLADFLSIYYGTMKRREAREYYYFTEEFFLNLNKTLRGSYVYFHTIAAEKVVSTELVLISGRYLYSFLGGTREEWFESRPNDLLKHRIVEWGKNENKIAFVLGGGYHENDGIFQYKKSFAPEGARPFRVNRIVFDQKAYEELTEIRRKYEMSKGMEWTPEENYFPKYRS